MLIYNLATNLPQKKKAMQPYAKQKKKNNDWRHWTIINRSYHDLKLQFSILSLMSTLGNPSHGAKLRRFRSENRKWQLESRKHRQDTTNVQIVVTIYKGFIWLRIRANDRLSKTRQRTFGFHRRGNSGTVKRVLAPNVGLPCFMVSGVCGFLP